MKSMGLNIDGKGSILSSTYECPRGNWICSHMAAAAIHINKKGFSKTDLPNSWIARPKTGERRGGVKTMRDLFKPSKPAYRATSMQVTEEDRQSFLQDLIDNDVDCPFRWLLSPEIDDTSDPRAPSLIEELLPIFASDPSSFLGNVKVSKEQQEYVAEKTKLQRKSRYCGIYRHLRLTASNFGIVLKAIDRKENTGRPFPPSLFKSLTGEYNLERNNLGQYARRDCIEGIYREDWQSSGPKWTAVASMQSRWDNYPQGNQWFSWCLGNKMSMEV